MGNFDARPFIGYLARHGVALPTQKSRVIIAQGTRKRETNRGVRGNILSHASSVSNLTVELVLIYTVRGRILADMAGATGIFEHLIYGVFLWVEQVGAIETLAI